MPKGLTKQEIAVIGSVAARFERIEKVILYGSRSIGNNKKGSDVDLAIVGNFDHSVLVRFKATLEEETNLPYFFDVTDYRSIENTELKRRIDDLGTVICEKKRPRP